MLAHFNKDQIWPAYPPHTGKQNIQKSQEDLFLNLSYGTLNVQTFKNYFKIIIEKGLPFSKQTKFH